MRRLRNIINKIIWQIHNPHYYRGFHKSDLIIFDDYFPNPITGFRITEFLEIMQAFSSTKIIISSVNTYKYYGFKDSDFKKHVEEFAINHPECKNKLRKIRRFNNISAKLFYFVFLNNGLRIVPHLTKKKINFIFTLYPGGGFKMNDEQSDFDLKKIMSSKYFKGVIVNQECVKDYLIQKNICSEKQIHYIYGIPIPQEKLEYPTSEKEYFKDKKEFLDICFVAAKNLAKGEDKGYDLFIDVAIKLHKTHRDLKFHIIGGFSEKEIDVIALGTSIKFYGYIDANILPSFLKNFDVILSPNRPNMLGVGSFDGFPLGASIEASLVGCVMIATDQLNENGHFIENEEIIIIQPNTEDIISKIESLIINPKKLKQIGIAGMNKTKELYSYKNQIESRLQILKMLI